MCRSIGETDTGLSGTEIGQILLNANIPDIDPQNTKWKRLYSAFATWQNKDQCSNQILRFIQDALQTVRYIGKEETFHNRRLEINKRLSFIGTELTEARKFKEVKKATTIAEAEQRANRLKHKLENRNVHATILEYCKTELLVENYFHSVFEATKSIADRLISVSNWVVCNYLKKNNSIITITKQSSYRFVVLNN